MTQIEMIYDNNIIIGFKMKGHAGFNPGGPDIVCAALSTASQMTVNGILDWTGLDMADVVVAVDDKEGFLHIELPTTLHVSATVQQLFKSFELYIGLLVEGGYSEYIKLERRQKDDNETQRGHAMAANGLRAI